MKQLFSGYGILCFLPALPLWHFLGADQSSLAALPRAFSKASLAFSFF